MSTAVQGEGGGGATENQFLTMMLNHCRDYKSMLEAKKSELDGNSGGGGGETLSVERQKLRQCFEDLRAFLNDLEQEKLGQLDAQGSPGSVTISQAIAKIDKIMLAARELCKNMSAADAITPLSTLQSKVNEETMKAMAATANAGAGAAPSSAGGSVQFNMPQMQTFLRQNIVVGQNGGPQNSVILGGASSAVEYDEKQRDGEGGDFAQPGGSGSGLPPGAVSAADQQPVDFQNSVEPRVSENMDILVKWMGLNGNATNASETVLYTVEWKRLTAPRRLSTRSLRRFEANARNDGVGWETHSVGPKKQFRISGTNPQTKYAIRVRARPTATGSAESVSEIVEISTGVGAFSIPQKLGRSLANARFCILDCGSGHANLYAFRGVQNSTAGEFEMNICDDFKWGVTEYIQRESFSERDATELAKKLDALLMAQIRDLRGFNVRNTKIVAGLTGVNRTAWNSAGSGRKIQSYLGSVCQKSKLNLEFVKISEREEADYEQLAALYVFRQVYPHMYTNPIRGVFAFGGGSTQFTQRGRQTISISVAIGNKFPTPVDDSRNWFEIRDAFCAILDEKVREHGSKFTDLPLRGSWLGIAAAFHTTKTLKKYAPDSFAARMCTKTFVTRDIMLQGLDMALDNGPRGQCDDIRGVKMLCLMRHWLLNFFHEDARFFYFSKAGEGLKATWSLGRFLTAFEMGTIVRKSP